MAIDANVMRTLEFDKITARLADQASFSLGKEKARALQPSTRVSQIERHQQETAEALTLIVKCGSPPFGGLRDIRPIARRAGIGAVLEPTELLDVAETARGLAALRAYLLNHAGEHGAEVLADLGGMIESFPRLEQEIRRCIDLEGRVVDHASPTLAQIRARLRTLLQRVREQLDRLVRSPRGQKYLQDSIVTLRSGRYVVPVKQEYRGEVPGIVHDQSASGATLFVEPLPVVELNNQIRGVEREEEIEVERILQGLSDLVAQAQDSLVHAIETAGVLDFIFAKGNLALKMDAARPQINEEGRIVIRRGRHPLIQGNVVPIDFTLGEGFTSVVITGPNTGGKTVTLKTVGLFALMAQAGLHLPTEVGTEVPVFESVFADIGDEQSIEQNLSTFSSHMTHIVDIVSKADSRSLVLLDELGAGTDPTEGAALAIALLERLIQKGCRVVATTHYSELKSFAYNHPLVENASVEFDVETLRPTYRLSMGVAGKSNAFAISARLGLDDAIIRRAESLLTEDDRKVDDLIRRVEEDHRAAERDREEARKLLHRYRDLYERYHQAFEKLRGAREEVLAEAQREANRIVEQARREADSLVGRLRKAGRDDVEEEAKEVRRRLGELVRRQPVSDEDVPSGHAPRPALDPGQLRVGMSVRVKSLDQIGEVAQILGDGKVAVQVGALRVTVPVSDLQEERGPRAPGRADAPGPGGLGAITRVKASEVKSELDLRGMTVDEAIESTDKYIDDALIAGLAKVRIIHGKGTGALRRSVQEFVASHPRVRGFADGGPTEGGLGVTVVEL